MAIVVAVLAVVIAAFASNLIEATNIGTVGTLDADLRVRATNVLASMAKDLRSTQPGQVTVVQGSTRSISFFPITSVTDLGPNFAASATLYSWNSTLTTGHWGRSQIMLTPSTTPSLQLPVVGNVTNFMVTPLGTTALNLFANTTSRTFRLSLTLGRKVFRPTTANPDGKVSITVTTDVTVLRAE